MAKKLKKEELELMSYNDIANILLKEKPKQNTMELFSKIVEMLELPKKTVENKIGEFYTALTNDQRFILLEDGNWDHRQNHKAGNQVNDDDSFDFDDETEDYDDEEILEKEEEMFDNDNQDDDISDITEEYKNLVIVDEEELAQEEGDMMLDRLNEIEKKYEELGKELTKPETLQNVDLLTKLSKEQSKLEETVITYRKYKTVLNNIEEDKELLKDNDLKDIAKEELLSLEDKKEELAQKLETLLLPKDDNDDKNIIMELRGAAGGDEANIFAGDLFRMYQKYAEKQGWKVEITNAEESASGGFSQLECMIKGDSVYSKLKYESGAHRVQRIPTTESGGRIHTSTATVIVMPEAEDIEIEVKPEDIKVDVYRSGGAGGQSVNTTDSAVRMTHIPTGIVVTCQNERSQLQNKEKALQILKAKIYEEEQRKKEEQEGTERRNKIGTGDRSEKIRTYNYPQNRVTDHRIGLTLNKLDRIIEGELDEVIEALITEDQKRKLQIK